MQVSHGRSGQPSEQRTATFTGTVEVRKGPIGIASLEVDPRCLPRRM